ncbi:hypothetical protein ACFXA3_00520 [Streptomyces sp. NPDC059456]|uniref:hypothetical protein n=1 Tax=Streptomyces sp. NPDC059456 TaxID=3346838 RepID=UPI0036C3F104
MSLADIVRPHGRHRGATIRELHNRIEALQTSRRVLKSNMAALAAENSLLQRQLDTAGIELSGARLDLETAEREGIRLQAALDNATRLSVRASWARDIDPGDEPTHPIDVREIRARYGAASTNPAEYAPLRLSAAAEAGLL